jgi:hypothetical protein
VSSCALKGLGEGSFGPDTYQMAGKIKGKDHPRTYDEGPEGEYRYRSTLSITSDLDRGKWSTPRPGNFAQERPGTHFVKGWVGLRAGLDGCGKLAPTGIRSPDRPDCSESLYRLSCTKWQGTEFKLVSIT